jgi:hypothetical protein
MSALELALQVRHWQRFSISAVFFDIVHASIIAVTGIVGVRLDHDGLGDELVIVGFAGVGSDFDLVGSHPSVCCLKKREDYIDESIIQYMQLFGRQHQMQVTSTPALNTITQSIRKKKKEEKIRHATEINIFSLLNHTESEKFSYKKISVSLELSGSYCRGSTRFLPLQIFSPSIVSTGTRLT